MIDDPYKLIFSINNIELFANTKPKVVNTIKDVDIPTDYRINHFLIKNNDDLEPSLSSITNPDVLKFIELCLTYVKDNQLPIQNRYWYLTIDQGLVDNHIKTLRLPGWHIDGLQGSEVPVKKPGDFQFIWSNVLPTEFCTQHFDVTGLDPLIHNVFNFLGKQVDPKNVYSFDDGDVVLMHCYHVHRAKELIGDVSVYRKFLRLSFTCTPITSTKMTVNDDIVYNYAIHTTTGNIPDNLL